MYVELVLISMLFIIILRMFVYKSREQRIYDMYPGPRSFPFIGSILEFNYPKVEITETFKQLSYKYGPVYLMWMGLEPVVCLRSPEDVEIILGSTTDIDKAPSLYWPLYAWLNQGLLTSGGDRWRKHRKILTPAFHFKILEKFIPVFVKNSHILIGKLSEKMGKEFNVVQDIALCSLDIISETTMGFYVNAQLMESEYVNAVNELQEIMAHRNYNFLQRTFLFSLLSVGRRHDQLISYLHNMTENIIKERKTKLEKKSVSGLDKTLTTNDDVGIKEKKVFLDLLLEFNKEGAGMTDSEIRDEVDTFLFEGYDTTTSTTSFCLYCLSQNLHVQNTVFEEMEGIFGDSDRDCTYQDLHDMKYLDKVIKETLRLYPTAQFVARKIVRDLQLQSGYSVPKGTSVMVLIEAMNHDPQLHPEPLKFDPDRFDVKNPHPYAYVPFSAGPRNCIGQKYAVLEIKAMVSLILRKFRLLPSDIPVLPWFNIVMKSRTGVHLRIESRTK